MKTWYQPPSNVLEAHNVTIDQISRLTGGQGNTFASNEIIFKPVFNRYEVLWYIDNFSKITSFDYLLATPLCGSDGEFIIDGWWAQKRLRGNEITKNWAQKVKLSESLHQSLSIFEKPNWINQLDDPYSCADRMAWDESPLSYPEEIADLVSELLIMKKPITLERHQLIHGDLSGNMLYDQQTDQYAIIDFALYWRPAAYAKAIIISDAISWEGADQEVFSAIKSEKNWFQLVVRAELSRILQKGTLNQMQGVPIIDLSHHRRAIRILQDYAH